MIIIVVIIIIIIIIIIVSITIHSDKSWPSGESGEAEPKLQPWCEGSEPEAAMGYSIVWYSIVWYSIVTSLISTFTRTYEI